jgi:hypothetical protein
VLEEEEEEEGNLSPFSFVQFSLALFRPLGVNERKRKKKGECKKNILPLFLSIHSTLFSR